MKIVFYGGDSQTGTTMVALSVGQLLAERDWRILYIDASGHPGSDFLPRHGMMFLEELSSAAEDGRLEWKELQRWILPCRGMEMIPGVRSFSGADRLGERELSAICRAAEGRYDMILIDGGCGTNALSRAALKQAEAAVVVATQQEKILQRMEGRLAAGGGRLPEKSLLAVNRYHNGSAFYTAPEMAEKLGWGERPVIRIPFAGYGMQAEQDRATLLKHRAFRKGAEEVAGQVERWCGHGI